MSKQNVKLTIGPNVRFSYAHVWEPTVMNEGDKPKYSVSILINKQDTAAVQKFMSSMCQIYNPQTRQASMEALATWGGKIPANLQFPLRDGDQEADTKGEDYRGHWFFTSSTLNPPAVLDKYLLPIQNREDFYSGCYGAVSVTLYPYNFNNMKKGVGVALNGVMKKADGEPMGATVNVREEFSQFAEAAPAADDFSGMGGFTPAASDEDPFGLGPDLPF